jgi:hypothetical protein
VPADLTAVVMMYQQTAVGVRGQSHFICEARDRTYRKRGAGYRSGSDNAEGMKSQPNSA